MDAAKFEEISTAVMVRSRHHPQCILRQDNDVWNACTVLDLLARRGHTLGAAHALLRGQDISYLELLMASEKQLVDRMGLLVGRAVADAMRCPDNSPALYALLGHLRDGPAPPDVEWGFAVLRVTTRAAPISDLIVTFSDPVSAEIAAQMYYQATGRVLALRTQIPMEYYHGSNPQAAQQERNTASD
ncbi:MAG: hypothetical protein JSS45_01830 [Proteobacteria bacterium]|nr:hypothetical protein [Pseudomonadota bacterium]